MSAPKLLGERHILFLDEQIARGIEVDTGAAYPPLTVEERRVIKVIANGLYLSESSLQWGFWNAQHGGKDAFRKVLEVLSCGRLKPLTPAG